MASYEKLGYDRILTADRHGDGPQIQMYGGDQGSPPSSPVAGNIAIYDANGNVIDGGTSGIVSGGGTIWEMTVAQFDAALDTSPATFASGDQILLTDGLYRVFMFDAGPSYYFGTHKVYRPPSTGWSWDNQTTSTIDSANGHEYLKAVKQSAVKATWRYRTAPSAPYTITAAFLVDFTGATVLDGNGTAAGVQLLFRESGTGKAIDIRYSVIANNTAMYSFSKWTTSASFSADYAYYGPFGTLSPGGGPKLLWMRITNDNTNISVYLSIDGLHWHQMSVNKSKTDFMAGGPDQVGFGAYCNASSVAVALISWQES